MSTQPDSQPEIPAFADLAADPEIAPLLDFDPVVRKIRRHDGWTPDLQRELIARIASAGTVQAAVWQMGKHATGAEALYKTPSAASFRASWDAAVAIGRRRNGLDCQPPYAGDVPGINRRSARGRPVEPEPLPGQVRNEHGEWEDEMSIRRRAADARDNITRKLLNSRRLYLSSICDSAGKRAAFEILTDYPIDWEAARRLDPQPDEPFAVPNMRNPDMLLTAENGWMGAMVHGPDKMAELQRDIDEYRAAEGLPAINWEDESTERSDAGA